MFYLLVILFLQAYNYSGQNLLNQDKCGDAIRALQEAKKSMLSVFVHFLFNYYVVAFERHELVVGVLNPTTA